MVKNHHFYQKRPPLPIFVSDLQTSLMFERQATFPNADVHDMLTSIITPYLGK